ncbi:MAG: type II secretion system F family protein [Planctomycetales bacterium]|nr:type II secretion system F family protein [Planctomycetales bacterium]
MNPIAVNLLTFLGVFFTIFAGNAVLVDFRSDERKRLRRRMEEQYRQQQRTKARSTPLPKEFSRIAAEVKSEMGEKRTMAESLEVLIDQSGLNLTVRQLLVYSVAASIICGMMAFAVTFNFLAFAWSAVAGAFFPLLYVQLKRSERFEKLRNQLPDAFELMARVMRAGQTTSQAIQFVSDEFARPVSLEFLYCYEQMNLGLPPEEALRDLARRTGLLEIQIFVLAVVVHQQTGGNLSELLEKLSYVTRERFRISGMIKSLTAQGRLQAGILLSLPPVMFGLLLVLHYSYASTLFEYPMMIVVALSMMAMGALWIRKIVNFDY